MENGEIFTADSGRAYRVTDRLTLNSGEALVFKTLSLDEETKPVRVLKQYKKSRVAEARFYDERETFDILSSENNGNGYSGIVRLHDSSEKQHSLVLEYMEGGDLATVIDKRGFGNFSLLETLAMTMQVSGILSEILQNSGVVHRDVKPLNVLLSNLAASKLETRNDKNIDYLLSPGEIKLCDFALSLRNGVSRSHESKKDGHFLGSLLYCSPEICLGETGGASADVWALSITVYDMLSRKGAFPLLKGIKEVHQATVEGYIPKIGGFRGFEKFLYRMRSYFPEERPTMKEVHETTRKFYDKLTQKSFSSRILNAIGITNN